LFLPSALTEVSTRLIFRLEGFFPRAAHYRGVGPMSNTILFIVIGLTYVVLKIYLEKRLAPLDAVGDERELSDLAFANGNSVYEVFKTAGSIWNLPAEKPEDDFKIYLQRGTIPHYVRDYLRRQVKPGDRTYQELIFSGGRPPYL
jgi:hypothetical protein